MSRPFRLTRKAIRDLDSIGRFIAEENVGAALAWNAEIEAAMEFLAIYPMAGRDRGDLREGLPGFPLGNYTIFYRLIEETVVIDHVVDGRRDLKRVYRQRP